MSKRFEAARAKRAGEKMNAEGISMTDAMWRRIGRLPSGKASDPTSPGTITDRSSRGIPRGGALNDRRFAKYRYDTVNLAKDMSRRYARGSSRPMPPLPKTGSVS